MSVAPYTTVGGKSNNDGKFYGSVSYGGAVIASVVEGTDPGFKTEKDFDGWALNAAHDHKWSNAPSPTHEVKKSYAI